MSNKPEPMPQMNLSEAIWPLVIREAPVLLGRPPKDIVVQGLLKDMRDRDVMGRAKYGTSLQPFNGRNPLIDAYQEALDLCVYIRQGQIEGRGWATQRRYELALNMAHDLKHELMVDRGGA